MKRILILFLHFTFYIAMQSHACTNLIVGKKASADGSVIVTYSSDDYGAYGYLFYQKGGKHQPGEMRKLYHYESNNYLGEIPEADSTYAVIGLTNEHQLTILETTWGGREELADSTGLFDYGSLMQVTLQRARTAREALQVMTSLVEKYGYQSEGESFTIADPNEVWVMDMIGKGPGGGAPVWVAVRIPDDCISGHANQSRIHQFDMKDKENVRYSKDVISFARRKGYFTGKDSEFSFANAYSPTNFHMQRACEARVWSFYNRHCDGMERYLPYVSGEKVGADGIIPLYVKPKHKVSLRMAMDGMRDHYEGTPFDMTKGPGGGAWDSPYRPRPQEFEVDGKRYFFERPIATQQSCCTMVCQMRSWLPDAIGGIIWFGNDDANMVTYTPVYCQATRVPTCYNAPGATDLQFSWDSAFWVCNWVSNMTYPRYSRLFPDVMRVREELQDKYLSQQADLEARAQALCGEHLPDVRELLTSHGEACAAEMLARWKKLGEYLIVKHNDLAVKPETNGEFDRTTDGLGAPPLREGYNENYRRIFVNETGDRYLVPEDY